MEGSGHGLIKGTIPALTGGIEENHEKSQTVYSWCSGRDANGV
jgi:hypothetical protein